MAVKYEKQMIPIYSTPGDFSAMMIYPYLFNPQGEWIGWVADDRSVFDVDGYYVGELINGPRIVKKRNYDKVADRRPQPCAPIGVKPPAVIPLAPLMAELPFNLIDVLDEEPQLLHTPDTGAHREDMD